MPNLPANPLRLVSLVPSLSELLAALGLGAYLVGRTGFCVHPADLMRDIPKLGGTKDVLLPRLRELAPSHLLVNVDENRLDLVEAIESWPDGERPRLIVTHPCAPEDVPAMVRDIAARLADWPALPDAHRALLLERAAELCDAIGAELELTTPSGSEPQRVLYLIWRRPWMTVARDTYLSRMLARIGWTTWPDCLGGTHGAARYPVLRGDEAWLSRIDRVLLSSEPYAFGDDHLAEASALCPRARVQRVDGEALSWYGPRTIDGLRLLRRLAAGPHRTQAA